MQRMLQTPGLLFSALLCPDRIVEVHVDPDEILHAFLLRDLQNLLPNRLAAIPGRIPTAISRDKVAAADDVIVEACQLVSSKTSPISPPPVMEPHPELMRNRAQIPFWQLCIQHSWLGIASSCNERELVNWNPRAGDLVSQRLVVPNRPFILWIFVEHLSDFKQFCSTVWINVRQLPWMGVGVMPEPVELGLLITRKNQQGRLLQVNVTQMMPHKTEHIIVAMGVASRYSLVRFHVGR